VEWALLRKKGINVFKPVTDEVENTSTVNDPSSDSAGPDGRD